MVRRSTLHGKPKVRTHADLAGEPGKVRIGNRGAQ
jgi:hypothetical protein